MVYLPKSSSNSRAKARAASQHLSENKQSKCRAEDEGAAAAAEAGEREVGGTGSWASLRWSLPVVGLISMATTTTTTRGKLSKGK